MKIVKICAESQLDDPAAKFGAVAALEQFIKDGTVIKDVDALDLLDWSTRDYIGEDEFPKLVGPLRVRAAKASPKDRNSATRCLESCLLHWDLNSAQQVHIDHPTMPRRSDSGADFSTDCSYFGPVIPTRAVFHVLEYRHNTYAISKLFHSWLISLT
jgi:hypothetical protein